MARRRGVPGARDVIDETVARVLESVATEFDRLAREQMLREAGPVLENLEVKARELGPVGKPWADEVARLLRHLRRGVRRRRR